MMRRYRQLPPIVQTPLDDIWEVLLPVARTNLVSNPSLETNTTSWTAIGGSIARSTTQQYHGAYSLAITPTSATTDGARFDTVSLTSGTLYAYSAKVLGALGVPYKLSLETTGSVELSSVTFRATGRWQWIYGYYQETSSTTRRLTIRKATHASTAVFYLDGAQVEAVTAGETVSTYIDGDQQGLVANQSPAAYYWNGTPHASTSARSSLTRAGGMIVRFKDYGFFLTAIIGLGLAAPQNVSTEYGRIDGSFDDYTRKPTRQFTITGTFYARSYAELRDLRGGLADMFDRDLSALDQELILRHTAVDGCGAALSDTVRIACKYQGGLGGTLNSQVGETTPITFTQSVPMITADNESGASLNVQTSLSNAQGIVQRSAGGTWSAMGSGGTSGAAVAIVQGLDGKIYAAGDFTQMGLVANTNNIAVWDPVAGSWSAMGTGASGGAVVYALAVMPNGDIIAAGDFTSMGGVANTNKIAKWNGSAWSSISSGFTGTAIFSLSVSPLGILYAGGLFSVISGTAADNVASYNGSTWSAVGAGIPGASVLSVLAVGSYVYAAVENTGVSRYNGSSWSSVGAASGGGADPKALAVDKAGTIYAAGDFTSMGGVSASNIAKYNGVSWSPLGSGLTGGTAAQNALFFDAQGFLNVGGTFTAAGGITMPGRSARWNGSTWVYLDIIPDAGSPTVRAGLLAVSGVFYLGLNNSAGTATTSATTAITNTGTARTYPTITIKGPSSGTARIYSIINPTTNRSIYLNLTINAGETCTLNFQPDSLSFTSDFQGNIASSILAGSNEADFFLSPGANTIAFLSASSTVTAAIRWRPAFASLDDVP